jgi:hypothetical protein
MIGSKMRAVVDYQDEQLEIDVAEDRVIGSFQGPPGINGADLDATLAEALESPRDFPPVSKMLVPGDRVAIAVDSSLSDVGQILSVLVATVREAIGDEGQITVIATPERGRELEGEIPVGVEFVVHDPSDQSQIAYLASTKGGRRVYLSRHLTDADVVIPVGELRFDPILGCRGPWSVIFPGLSDEATRKDYEKPPASPTAQPTPQAAPSRIDESIEASWLLGSQFCLGLIPGRSGISAVIAGLGTSVRDQGTHELERLWSFRANSRADLVVAGIGRPGEHPTLEDLVDGIETARGLVEQGGKIAILSRASGPVGPALQRLIDVGDPIRGASALKSHQSDSDYAMASQLNRAIRWADIYLLSDLDSQTVEDLSMVPLDRAREAARLAAVSRSCIFLSQADLARVQVADDLEPDQRPSAKSRAHPTRQANRPRLIEPSTTRRAGSTDRGGSGFRSPDLTAPNSCIT